MSIGLSDGALRALAMASEDKVTDEKWSAIVEHHTFSRDLRQLPMADQDRVFRAVSSR